MNAENMKVSLFEISYQKITISRYSNFLSCTCMYVYIYIYIYMRVNNALTQIPFNGTNFINTRLTQRVFSIWPVAQPVFGEMEMHSVANLATLQTPLAIFFPFKKRPKPYLVPENCTRSCFPSTCTHISLSLSLSLSLRLSAQFLFSARTHISLSLSLSLHLLSFCLARGREEQSLIQLNTGIMLLASLILHASIAKITAQLLSLSYGYFI